MVFKNSENAMAIVSGTIDAKKNIALESFSTMAKTRMGEARILALEASGTFQEFSSKINDVFSTLQNIDVDETEITTFLKEISRAPKNLYEDSAIVFVNPDNVGRINASYIQDFAQDIAATAERILSGDITSISGTNVASPVIEGIKRQLVAGTYKGNTSKNCFEELPKGIPYSYDASFINGIAIPFVKSFSAKRAEVAAEIAAIEKASESSFAIISSISQSKEILSADTDSRQLLNVYLSAAGTAMVDIVSFASYLIIRKMDIMIANATALNEMCDNIRSNGLIRLAAEAAVDEETPAYGIENADMLIGVVRGVYGKVKYSIMNYYGETSHPIDDQTIISVRDKYSQMVYPAEVFINILSEKKEAIEKLQDILQKIRFPSPVQFATDLGLYNSMIPMYVDKIESISDISAYTNNDSIGVADKAFASLAELHDLEEIIRKIVMCGNEISVTLEELKRMAQNPTGMTSNSDAVRKEVLDVVEAISSNINMELIPEVFGAIDKRCVSLDSYIDSILDSEMTIVPDMSCIDDETDYVESAMQSVLSDEEIYANAQITEAARKFRSAASTAVTFIMTEAESPAINKSGATPGNPTTTGTGADTSSSAKSGKGVEVSEDGTKRSTTDTAQNDNAADSVKKDPRAFKDSIKKILDQAMKFFDDMISNFGNTIKSKKNDDAAQYITGNKDAILNRSFNGVTLKIPFFPELNTSEVVKEIGQVTAAVGALNAQSINNSTEDKLATLLFPFADFGNASTPDDRIKAVKERYTGKENAAKEEFSGAKLRNKTQKMMEFCEEYYVAKKCNDVSTALQTLKNTTKTMMNGLSSITDMNTVPEDAKVRFITRSVKMFAGAITTTYRNQANAYYSALKSLTPKKRTSKEAPIQGETPPADQQST